MLNTFQLPEVIVHRFEEEFAIWLLENIFEVRQCHFVRWHRQLHQIWGLLVVEVVDNFGLPHLGQRLWRRGRQGASSRGPRRLPLGPRLPVALAAAVPWSSRFSLGDWRTAKFRFRLFYASPLDITPLYSKRTLLFHANVWPPTEHRIAIVPVCFKLAIWLWKLMNIPVKASKRRNGNQSPKGRFPVSCRAIAALLSWLRETGKK